MRPFYHLLVNSLIGTVTNFFVWAGVIYWSYSRRFSSREVHLFRNISDWSRRLWILVWFDRGSSSQETAMLISSTATLVLFSVAWPLCRGFRPTPSARVKSAWLWSIAVILLCGVMRVTSAISPLPTAVTFLVPEERRAKGERHDRNGDGNRFAVSNVGPALVSAVSAVLGPVFRHRAHAGGDCAFLFIRMPGADEAVVSTETVRKSIDIKARLPSSGRFPDCWRSSSLRRSTFSRRRPSWRSWMPMPDARVGPIWGTLWGFLSRGSL